MAEERYNEWIAEYLQEVGNNGYGRCEEATRIMVKVFPELTRVAGHVETIEWGRRAHWWCTTPNGVIVDPTAAQFSGISEYEPLQVGSLIRTGKCMNCGDEIWKPCLDPLDLSSMPTHDCSCSPECETMLLAAFG
jgi:hypothetical protein